MKALEEAFTIAGNWMCKFTVFLVMLTLIFKTPGVTNALAAGSEGTPNITITSTSTVTNNADSGPDSLRQAIANASDGDTINFNDDYIITLASHLEIINKTVTIIGTGHHITINGNNAVRVFYVGDGIHGSGNLTIDHLNIVNGARKVDECAGSGVACGGGLMLEYLTAATVSNSTFSNNDGGLEGGAIYAIMAI